MVNLNFLCFGLSPLLFIMPKMSMEKRLFPSFLFSADIYIFLFALYHLSLYQNNPTSSKLIKVMFFTPDCFVFIPYIMPMQRQVHQEGIILRDGGGNSVFYKKMLLKWYQSFSSFFFFPSIPPYLSASSSVCPLYMHNIHPSYTVNYCCLL